MSAGNGDWALAESADRVAINAAILMKGISWLRKHEQIVAEARLELQRESIGADRVNEERQRHDSFLRRGKRRDERHAYSPYSSKGPERCGALATRGASISHGRGSHPARPDSFLNCVLSKSSVVR